MYDFYIDIVLLCAAVLFIKVLFRKRLVLFTTITIFCFMSLFSAIMMIDLIRWGMAGYAPEYGGNFNNISDFTELGKVLFFSTLAGATGGLLADLFFASNRTVDQRELRLLQINTILQRFSFVLTWNALFGIARFIIIFRYLDRSTFGDYRMMICFDLFTKMSWLESTIFRISNHLYVLAGFYIFLSGMRTALSGNLALGEFIKKFIFFSIPTMAMGGRLFILNFLVFFFSGLFFTADTLSKFPISWKTFQKLLFFILTMAALVCIIGSWRNQNDITALADEENRLWGGLGYITDANVILGRCLEYNLGGEAPAFESTFGSAKTFLGHRESWMDMTGYVNGLYSHLYFDFDLPGMYFMWGGLCFLMEAITLGLLSRGQIFGLLICCVFAKIMEEMFVFPSISGNYYCFEWILVLYIIYLFWRKDNKTLEKTQSEKK